LADIETYRSVVSPADCDILGHMNVSRYFWACGNGVFALQARIGLGRSEITGGRRLSFAVVHTEGNFLAEVLPGDVIYLRTGILTLGGKSVDFRHRLFTAERDALVFKATFRSVLLDLESRRGVPIPDDIRDTARAFMVEDAGA